MSVAVLNILDLFEQSDEETIQNMLSGFSCEKDADGESRNLNPDIEHFIRNNALQFAREKIRHISCW